MASKNDVQPLLTGKQFKKKISGIVKKRDADRAKKKLAKKVAAKVGRKFVKGLPVVGGVVSAIASKDVSAAIPVLGSAEKLGPKKGSLGHTIENPSASKAERAAATKKLLERNNKKRKK